MKIQYRLRDYLNLTTHTALGISFRMWLKLLWKNKFDIDLPYLPKALFITCTALLNIPLHAWEHFRYSKRIKKTNVAPLIFILGHPRSGTTFLQYLLSKDPHVAFCSTVEGLTPNIFLTAGKFTERILDAAMPETRPQDNVKAGATLPIEEEFAMGNISEVSWVHGLYFPRNIYKAFDQYVTFSSGNPEIKMHWKQHFDFFLRKLSFKYPGKTLVLKSPANTGRLRELLELYPAAKFIHIHRNPLQVYQSNERLYEKILPLIGFQKVSSDFIKEHILYAYEKMYKKYLSAKSLVPTNQLVEFSYEDFIKSPLQVVRNAYEQLQLDTFESAVPFFEAELKSTDGYKPNSFLKMDSKEETKIRERWKFAFDAFGYSATIKSV